MKVRIKELLTAKQKTKKKNIAGYLNVVSTLNVSLIDLFFSRYFDFCVFDESTKCKICDIIEGIIAH